MASSPVHPMSDMNYSAYTAAQNANSETAQLLATFWPRITNEIRSKPIITQKTGSKKDEPVQELPLARIKKIMKQDGDVKMISAEAPIVFSKAAEIFISELSLRAWIHTEDNKRRTLQRNDIAMAITKYDQFDFLIDIVPRDELKPPPPKRQEEVVRQPPNVMAPEQVQYYFQLSNLPGQSGAAGATGSPSNGNHPSQISQLPAGAHIIQQPNGQIVIAQPQQLAAVAQQPSSQQSMVSLTSGDTQSTSASDQTDSTGQKKVDETMLQVQFTGPNQQVQYVRIPQSALNSSNLSQVLALQQQLQSQQQPSGTTGQETSQHSSSTQQQQQSLEQRSQPTQQQHQQQQQQQHHQQQQQHHHQHHHQAPHQQSSYSQMYEGM